MESELRELVIYLLDNGILDLEDIFMITGIGKEKWEELNKLYS